MADASGTGLPLAYIFVSTSSDTPPGAKQSLLEKFLTFLKARGVDPRFTLSDKDQSEINALEIVFPFAKHQLCLWHGLRAFKQRLSNRKTQPAFYHVDSAVEEFSFIDPKFLPFAQRSKEDRVVPVSPFL